jgi:RNA polymerase sigma-70 factor (ECF subfamily)
MRAAGDTLPGRAGNPLSVTPPAEALAPDVASLYRMYAAKVGRWAARLGGPSIEVEDVVQEVFLVAKRRLVSFRSDGGGSVTTWLFRATDRSSRRRDASNGCVACSGWRPTSMPPERASRRARSRATTWSSGKRWRAPTACSIACPERHRRVLILFELEGLSTQEIATLIGARAGTVRVWLYRARAAFLQHHDEESQR